MYILSIPKGLWEIMIIALLVSSTFVYWFFWGRKKQPHGEGLTIPHHLDEPAEVIERIDVPQDEIVPAEHIPKRTVSIEETDLPNLLKIATNFFLAHHKDLGAEIQKVRGIAFAKGASDYPPEFDDQDTQEFTLKKVMEAEWVEILPAVVTAITKYFNGDVAIRNLVTTEYETSNNIDL